MLLAVDAFSLLVPDIFVDTMGYAFAIGMSKLLFPDVPTAAYVHYPTISTDMLESLDSQAQTRDQGVNAGQGTGARGRGKKLYWKIFAHIYAWIGIHIDVVMTNSSWTLEHISALWEPRRRNLGKKPASILYPPVAVDELLQSIEVSSKNEEERQPLLVYIAQFRPEKNHKLVLDAFSKFKTSGTAASKDAKLILIGSVRDDSDSKRVYELRLLANELHIKDCVEFHLDVPWPEIIKWLRKASVGVNGMWNEHFGIGVVEYQAAGLMAVVHASGGPRNDVVVDVDGLPTGKKTQTTHMTGPHTDMMIIQVCTQARPPSLPTRLRLHWHSLQPRS